MDPHTKKTMSAIRISVANDFSYTPGSRYRSEGEYSGEEFLEDHALPAFEEARERKVKLVIDLDGVAGYATSFLEETFGGLSREFGPEAVRRRVEVVTEDDPYLKRYIERYIGGNAPERVPA